MKTSIFDMTFVLPPLVEMTQVEKEMQNEVVSQGCFTPWTGATPYCQETDMKTSIFNMNLTLPPLVEMVEVEKDMPNNSFDVLSVLGTGVLCNCYENIHL